MKVMSCDDIEDGPHRELAIGSSARPVQDLLAKAVEKDRVGRPQMSQLDYQALQAALIEIGPGHPTCLVHPRERRWVAPGKLQRPEGEQPFHIDDVANHLSGGPFPRCVLIIQLLLRYVGEQLKARGQLSCQDIDDVPIGHQADVLVIEVVVFASVWRSCFFRVPHSRSSVTWL